MKAVYTRCCGIDVHKKLIVACLRTGRKTEIRKFGTMSRDILELVDWLSNNRCEMAAMESTGSYWKPIYNLFELHELEIIVVNAHHMKNVPGRKTDIKDAEWIADLLQHGLLKASFIPPKGQRELREVVRYRKSLVEERSRELNRLQKFLEGANIKLSSYVSKINGKSSRNLIEALLDDGVTDKNIDKLIHPSMKSKKETLLLATDGLMTDIQKQLLRAVLDHIDDMTRRIEDLNRIITDQMGDYQEAIKKLEAIPGIGTQSAETILAETGMDMSRFPNAQCLCSWAGLSPGNNESASKRYSGKTTKGNKTLKTTLIQSAMQAKKDKKSFFYAQYQRLVVRRGKNRANVAVAHSMLIAIYHILNENIEFIDLGSDYYNQQNPEAKMAYHLRKIQELQELRQVIPSPC